jgi:hypothetical protein
MVITDQVTPDAAAGDDHEVTLGIGLNNNSGHNHDALPLVDMRNNFDGSVTIGIGGGDATTAITSVHLNIEQDPEPCPENRS